jgi:hypothetical protein
LPLLSVIPQRSGGICCSPLPLPLPLAGRPILDAKRQGGVSPERANASSCLSCLSFRSEAKESAVRLCLCRCLLPGAPSSTRSGRVGYRATAQPPLRASLVCHSAA